MGRRAVHLEGGQRAQRAQVRRLRHTAGASWHKRTLVGVLLKQAEEFGLAILDVTLRA
jgi:hypothetical protein